MRFVDGLLQASMSTSAASADRNETATLVGGCCIIVGELSLLVRLN